VVTRNTGRLATLDRYSYDKEKRTALEKWAEVLAGRVRAEPQRSTTRRPRASRLHLYEFKPALSIKAHRPSTDGRDT
jgi:hypothetical protein